jgi:hypothetical protein
MNTVPNELVEAILVLATPGTAAALGSGAVYDPLDMLVGRLRLASVCRLWRDLLQDCNLHQLLLQSLSTTAAAPPPPLSLYLRPRKDPHRPRCGLREACWIIAHQQCKYVGHYTPPAPINIWRCLILVLAPGREMWGCTWQALRPLARSAQEPVDFRKRLIANLLRQARVWFGGGSRARSAAELQEWGARTQAKEEEQLKQFQRHLNADSTQLDRKYIEESSNMPLYLQRPWKEMQAAAVELLSSLKAVRHPIDSSVFTCQRAHSDVYPTREIINSPRCWITLLSMGRGVAARPPSSATWRQSSSCPSCNSRYVACSPRDCAESSSCADAHQC